MAGSFWVARVRAQAFIVVALVFGIAGSAAHAVADGVPLTVIQRRSVFGSAIAVGNTLMEHDGRVNFAVRVEGSQASVPFDDVLPDATVVQAYLYWGGTFDDTQGIPQDRTIDFRLPNGTLFNDLSVDVLRPGEGAPSPANACRTRNQNTGGGVVQMFSCRRDVTTLLRNLGAGGSVGVYDASDVNLVAGDCNLDPGRCEARFGGWALVLMWESPTEPVKRDLALADGFFVLDEQSQGVFSSGISPDFVIDGLNVGGDESGELTFLAWEGDAQLGVPPQNLAGNPFRCNDGRCEDFVDLRTSSNPSRARLVDPTNRRGNVMNGSNNKSGGSHPGLDIDTFDIGATGQQIIATGDTSLSLRAGSGDGVPDDASGGSGELFLLNFALVSVETFAPRFSNNGTEKVVLEGVAGPGEQLNYILRIENDGSASANNVILKDQLPGGTSYVPNSTVNTCGVASPDVGGTSPLLAAAGLNVGTMVVNERCEVRFRVTVQDTVSEGDQLRNFFTVQADGVPPQSVGPATTIIENAELAQPLKSVSVVGGGEPAPGATLNYRFRVDNAGSRPAPDVSIADLFPAELEGITLVSAPAGANATINGNDFRVDNIDIGAGSFAEVVVSARIRVGTAVNTVIVNQAEVDQPSLVQPLFTDDPAVNNVAADPTTVRVSAGIDLTSSTKTGTDVNGGSLVPGDVIEYRVRVDKRGATPTVVTIDDDLPANVGGCVVVAPVPAGASASCAAGGVNNTGRFTALTAFTGAAVQTFVFRVIVAADAVDGATIRNTAAITPLADPALAQSVSSAPLVVFARPDLVLQKAVVDQNGGDVKVGDALRYSVTLRNAGTTAIAGLVVTDVVDANLTAIAAEDAGVVAGQTITWNVGALAVGASVVVDFVATVRAGVADGTSIANSARATATAPQTPVTSNTVTVVVRAAPVLALRKTFVDVNGAPTRPGDIVRYTLTLTNTGDGAARDVVVRDVLDAAFDAPIFTSGGRLLGGAVVFDDTTIAALDTVNVGDTVVMTFDARLDAALANAAVVPNQATATTPSVAGVTTLSDDPSTATPNDPTRFTITSAPALRVQKTATDDNGGALLPGDTVTYAISVENVGDDTAAGVVITDPLDARLTFVSATDGGALTGGSVRYPAFSLAPTTAGGTPRLVRFTARVASPLANNTTIDNQASVAATNLVGAALSDDPATAAANDPTRITVTSRPVFDTSTKTVVDVDGDGVFRPGGAVRYTLTIENTGSENGAGVIVRDVVPPELTAIVAPGGVVTGNTVQFNLGTLAVGARQTFTIDAALRRPLADAVVVSNQAVISAATVPNTLTNDPTTAAPADPTRFVVTSKPRLTVQKTVVDANGAPAEPGDTLSYTLTLRSDGDRDATAVTVTDVVNGNLTGVVAQDGGVLAGNTITWTRATLALDTTTTLRFTAVVRSPLDNGTLIPNQASAAVAEANVPGAPFLSDDPNTAAPLDPTVVQIVSAADFTATTLETFVGGAAVATANPGAEVEYRLSVNNRGRQNGQNVVATVPFPAGFVVVDAAGGVVAGTTITYALGAVAAAATVERRPRVRLPTPLDNGATLDVQAAINATGLAAPFRSDDPSTAAPSDPTRLVVTSAPVLVVQKTFVDVDAATDAGVIEPGDTVRYDLRLENTGNAVARDVVVTDVLAATLDFVSGGTAAANVVTFNRTNTPALAAVAPGGPVTLALTVRVKANTANNTSIANQASATTGALTVVSDDPLTGAPLDPTRFVVTAVPRVTFTKDIAGGLRVFAPGDVVSYSVIVTSTGTAAANGAFADVVDARLNPVTPGPGLAFNGATRTLSANVAGLAPGTARTFSFSAVVGAVPNGTTIANQATFTDAQLGTVRSDDPLTAAPADATVLTVDASPNLTTSTKTVVDDNGGAVVPGDTLTYTIVVDNSGAGVASDVRVSDDVDDALEVIDVDGGAFAGNSVVFDGTTTPALAAIGRATRVALTFTARVKDDVVDGTIVDNQAQIVSRDVTGAVLTDDPATAAVDDATRITVQAPVFVVTKTVATDNFVPGGAVAYAIRVENRGSIAATDVVIEDVVDGVLDGVTVTGGVVVGNTATAAVSALAPGGSVDVVVGAVVDEFAVGGTVVSNQATVRAREHPLVVRSDDPTTAAANDATVRVIAANEVYGGGVELFDGATGAPLAGAVEIGGRVRARITVTNTGSQRGRAVVIESPFDPAAFIVDEADSGGLIDADGDVRWTASQLPALEVFAPGQTVVVELEGRVAPTAADGSTIAVQGEVTSVSSTTPAIVGPASFVVAALPRLSASTKEVIDRDGGLVEPGDVLEWRITVLNDGGVEARDVVLTDAIPSGLTYLQNSTRVAGVGVDDGADGNPLAALPLGRVGAGRAVVVTFETRVAANVPRGLVLQNQAVLAGEDVNARTDDPRTPLVVGDPTTVVVGGGAHLVASKVGAAATARVGEPFTFAIAVENAGTEAATDVSVVDVLDLAAVSVVSATADNGAAVAVVGGTVRVQKARLEAGDGFTVTLVVTPLVPSPLRNQATVTSSEGALLTDADPSSPGAQVTIVPIADAPSLLFDEGTLELLDDNGGALAPGDAVTVRARLHNRSVDPAFVTEVRFAVPSGLVFAAADNPGFVVDDDGSVASDDTSIRVDGNSGADVALALRVADDTAIGARLAVSGAATVRSVDVDVTLDVDLGEDALTVGLLDGTAAVSGVLFVDNGSRDGVFVENADVAVTGVTLQAFWRDNVDVVASAVTDARGRFTLQPLPAGTTRVRVLTAGGAQLGSLDLGRVDSGEVRTQNLALEPSGAVYFTKDGAPARGARLQLFVDDGDDSVENDRLVDAGLLAPGQQDQRVSAQGFYRFDAPPGRYRIGVVTDDPTVTFPSATVPLTRDDSGHPLGVVHNGGDASDVAVPDIADPPPWVARFRVVDVDTPVTRNHIPLDRLSDLVSVTKTAGRKRASIGEIVTYEVRVENKAQQRFDVSDGGVEIVDTLPAGFRLVDGSYQLARIETDARGQQRRTIETDVPVSGARVLRFGPFTMRPSTTLVLRYNVVVGPGTKTGAHENTAALRLAEGAVPVSNVASAIVQVVADDTFDLSVVRAKVFCDDNGDGAQQAGERGVWGARVYLDNGSYADADVSGKLHFSGVAPGMHLAKLDERSLVDAFTADGRASFYLSAGVPAQVAFPVRCAALSFDDADDFDVNARAYSDEAEAVVHTVAGVIAAGVSVDVDDTALLLPQAELDVAVRGAPAPAAAGVVITPDDVLAFAPRAQAPARLVAWQLDITEVATATSSAASIAAPAATTAAGLEAALASASSTAAAWTPLAPTPLYLFAGEGPPPQQLTWNGRDDGRALLTPGRLYQAVLTVGVAGGDRVSTAPRFFAVQDAPASSTSAQQLAAIDESEGPLFTAAGKPTPRLLGFLGTHAAAAKGKPVEVRAHLDAQPQKPVQKLTADRAQAAKKALVSLGLDAALVVASGKGDEEPLFPNGREKDRKKNRRVELVVRAAAPTTSTTTLPPLPEPAGALSVRVNGVDATIITNDSPQSGVSFAHKTSAAVLVIDVRAEDGRALRLVRDAAAPQPPREPDRSAAAPRALRVDAATRTLTLDGTAVPGLGLLDVRVRTDGAGVVVDVPAGVDVKTTTLRAFVTVPGAPAQPDDDRSAGTPLPDVVVDGRVDRLPWPATAPAGQPVRLRAIVEDSAGNVGISPDVIASGPSTSTSPSASTSASPSSPSTSSASTKTQAQTTLPDPATPDGKLNTATVLALRELVRAPLPAGATVLVEAHSDDTGARLARNARTQALADAAKAVLVDAGVDAARVRAVGRGSDAPLLPNSSPKSKKQNRRIEVRIDAPAPTSTATSTAAPSTATRSAAASTLASLAVNGAPQAVGEGVFAADVAPLATGELALQLSTLDGARASLALGKRDAPAFAGTPAAYAATRPATTTTTEPTTEPATTEPTTTEPTTTATAEPATTTTATTTTTTASPATETTTMALPHKDGAPPAWWPARAAVPAASLQVALPKGRLTSERVPVRGRAAPECRVTVNGSDVAVSPDGTFATLVTLPRGASSIVVEATDSLGNKARKKSDVDVDNDGWFVLALADTAFGQDGAGLSERNSATSLSLGPVFLYGRGVAYVKGRTHAPYLFSDIGLTLHLDTRRVEDDLFFRDVLDPERGFPAWGDGAFEVQDAKSGFPLYVELTADHSSLLVGAVRTDLQNGELFRYQRARNGAQLHFDRGWTTPLVVADGADVADPAADPWRTQATTFFAGGGGERHARVELMGTGGSVYFLRHERVVEGSERVAILVRDGVTGAEIARTPKARNVDYTVRYGEGRVVMKEPISAFADAAFVTNHNLGQVASGHRVFVEVEYEHQDDRRSQGLAGGVDVTQTLFGHLDVGGAYVAEGRDDGGLSYQLGGVSARLFLDPQNKEDTWISAQLLGSQSVDAGNFFSFDGGLSYQSLGQSLDQKDVVVGRDLVSAERQGLGFKLDAGARFGQLLGGAREDGVVRGYAQLLEPGFFGGGSSIVEQGQSKWGVDAGWRVTKDDELRLRYDGVVSLIPERPPLAEFRTLHRQLATGRYQRALLPGLRVAGELGYGYVDDSGSPSATTPPPDDVHSVITAASVEWAVMEALTLGFKQEVIALGDPNQLRSWNDHFVTHVTARYALTEALSLDGGASLRWSGENQVHAGVGYRLNEGTRVYASERFGMLPASGTGTMGFNNTSVIGAETELAKGSKAYAEYQLQSAFSSEQTRAVVGLANQWALPFGFTLSLNYERITTIGAAVATTADGTVPPAALTDGTFYATSGANGGGNFLYGDGSRDAGSVGVQWQRGDLLIASERFELRYDNVSESRGGQDILWMLSMTSVALKLSPELSLLSRYNIGLAHNLALAQRAAYLEEANVGVAYRPITHDWLSVLTKLSRRVEVRPVGLAGGVVDDTTIHAASLEPIVELPFGVQLVEKLALKHMSVALDDVPKADATTALWINRVNWHALGTLRRLGVDPVIPGEIDLGVEYRVLAGLSYDALEHGALVELQYAPLAFFRVGVGYNFTRFSDNELDRGDIDRSGFFVRAVGQY